MNYEGRHNELCSTMREKSILFGLQTTNWWCSKQMLSSNVHSWKCTWKAKNTWLQTCSHIHSVWKWTKMSKIGLDSRFFDGICFDKFLLYKETEFAIPAFFETNFNFLQGFQHRCLKLIMKSPLSKFVNEWELQIFFLTWWPYVQTKWSIGT